MVWVLVGVLLVLVGSVISLDNCVELYIYLCSLYILIIQLDYITYKYSPSLSLSSSVLVTFQLHSTSIFFTYLLPEECFIPFKILLDEIILPARSGSILFLNLLNRRDAVLKILSLGASVAGMQRYFCARQERIGN